MKKASTGGLFFDKAAKAGEGHFFRDLPGRKDGTFHEKSAMSPGELPGNDEPKTTTVNAGATGAPIGGSGYRGEGVGGGIFGTGTGKEKKAGAAPSDWESASDLPTGSHRPAREQPEGLEAGGERFFDSAGDGVDFGASGDTMSTTEMARGYKAPGTGHQLGKHASESPTRFLGTSYGFSKAASAGDYLGARGSEVSSSLGRGVRNLGNTADKAIRSVTSSPLASALLLGLGGRFLLRGGAKGVRALGAARAAKKQRLLAAANPGAMATAASPIRTHALGIAEHGKGLASNIVSKVGDAARKLVGRATN